MGRLYRSRRKSQINVKNKKCYSKTGKLNKNQDKRADYHEFKCKKCGFEENRHSSAAMVEAISVKIAVEGTT